MTKYLPVLFLLLLFYTCNYRPSNTNNINQTTETVDSIKNDFFDDWEKQPFKGTMHLDGSTDEQKMKEMLSGNDPSPDFQLKLPNYRFIIHNYGMEQSRIDYSDPERSVDDEKFKIVVRDFNDYDLIPINLKDTINLYENVFEDLSNKLIEIQPVNKDDVFKISASVSININEVWDTRVHTDWNEDIYRDWEKSSAKLHSMSNLKQLTDSAKYYFRMPVITELYEKDFDEIFRTENMRDTIVEYPGEYTRFATLVYKNQPCVFGIPYIVLCLERLDKSGRLQETRYIRIEFSYGC